MDEDLNKQAAKLIAQLLDVYEQLAPEYASQKQMPDIHSTITSAQNLIDALKSGRVKLTKTDKWSD